MTTPNGVKVTAEMFRKVVHRVGYIIQQYVELGKLKYGWVEIDFPEGEDNFTIEVRLMESDCCGDTDCVDYFEITPEMIEEPDLELAKLFQARKKALLERQEKEKKRKEEEAKERKRKKEQRDLEEYQRLKKKYGILEAK